MVILCPKLEINCNYILCDIYSGAHEMLKSLCNHRQSQQPRRNGGLADAGHQIDYNWVCTSKQVGLEVNTIIRDVMGWRHSKSIELSSSDDQTHVADWVGVPNECNTDTHMPDHKCGRDSKHREALLWFAGNISLTGRINRLQYRLSIEMFIDDLRQNVNSVKREGRFEQIFARTVSLNVIQKQRK